MTSGVLDINSEEVVRTYSDMVYKIAFQYARNKERAEDIFSETFLIYFKKTRHFHNEEHRKAWLIRVTINCAKDLLRDRSAKTEASLDDIRQAAPYFNSHEKYELFEAVGRLKPAYRDVIHLFYYEDMTIRQIAGALQMNENTVKTNLSRAKELLRKEWRDMP